MEDFPRYAIENGPDCGVIFVGWEEWRHALSSNNPVEWKAEVHVAAGDWSQIECRRT